MDQVIQGVQEEVRNAHSLYGSDEPIDNEGQAKGIVHRHQPIQYPFEVGATHQRSPEEICQISGAVTGSGIYRQIGERV